jgi:hypothetical protein
MNQSSKAKITVFILILPLAIILFCFFGYIFVRCILESGMGAQYESPIHPANRILFSYGGGDEMLLFAKPIWGRTQFVARLEQDGAFRLGDFQWTKDGQVVVCSLMLLGEITTNDYASLSPIIAYDFSTGTAAVPSWLHMDPAMDSTGAGYKEADWRKFDQQLEKLSPSTVA